VVIAIVMVGVDVVVNGIVVGVCGVSVVIVLHNDCVIVILLLWLMLLLLLLLV
jgi:hypothetical protein